MAVPIDKELYERAKRYVKSRVKVWPSAYASGQLVRKYKSMGGRYSSSSSFGKAVGGLTRWFKERWVNVCGTKKKGKYPKCSRSGNKKYPYCRPSKRVTSKTPRTTKEISAAKLKKMCNKKTSKRRITLDR